MRTIKEALVEVRGLLAKGWCQGHYAVDSSGVPVHPYNKAACAFCIHGACEKVLGKDERKVLTPLRSALGEFTLAEWNDRPDRTQAEVLALFDKVIATQPEEQ